MFILLAKNIGKSSDFVVYIRTSFIQNATKCIIFFSSSASSTRISLWNYTLLFPGNEICDWRRKLDACRRFYTINTGGRRAKLTSLHRQIFLWCEHFFCSWNFWFSCLFFCQKNGRKISGNIVTRNRIHSPPLLSERKQASIVFSSWFIKISANFSY